MRKSTYLFIAIMGVSLLISCQEKVITTGYEGEDLSDIAQITRDKNTKAASLQINTGDEWEIYHGTTVETIDLAEPLLKGKGGGAFVLAVPDSVRSYFLLATGSGKAILAETHLPMDSGFNFRDLGGIRNNEGQYIKWGKLIRSDDLGALTEADMDYLSSLPLRTVVDFRSEEEIDSIPDRVPASVKLYIKLSMSPGNMSEAGSIFGVKSAGIDSLMMAMYEELVSSLATVACYKEFFALLQDEANIPLLYHCSAGKDRTGVATALILYALGVDEETIMQNYLESNFYLSDKYADYVAAFPQLKPLFEVAPQYLEAGINKIKSGYGSVENYLKEVLEVDVEAMRTLYLY